MPDLYSPFLGFIGRKYLLDNSGYVVRGIALVLIYQFTVAQNSDPRSHSRIDPYHEIQYLIPSAQYLLSPIDRSTNIFIHPYRDLFRKIYFVIIKGSGKNNSYVEGDHLFF